MRWSRNLLPLALLLWSALPGLVLGHAPKFTPGHGLDVREASITTIHEALFAGRTTCRDVVSAFLSRIEELNPAINAITALNPDALSVADSLDERIAAGGAIASLHCVPILVKDNYDVKGMATTSGCKAFSTLKPARDAPVVCALRAAGAVILGKTNMHEMALEGLTVSSLAGQTINPYDSTRTPGGSSGGSGAAVAAGLAVIGTGTDTVNSLRSPASANGLFSFRPSRGLISRAGVMPVSHTQDALGAMARNVKDLATVLEVMSSLGHDASDNATDLRPARFETLPHDSAHDLRPLEQIRLGVLAGFYEHTPSEETRPVIEAMDKVHMSLMEAGVELVNITSPIFNITALAPEIDVQTFEYREMLDEYLQTTSGPSGSHPKSFAELYRGKEFLVIPHQYKHIQLASSRSTGDETYRVKMRTIEGLRRALHSEFQKHGLDAIVYPEQRNLVVKVGSASQSGRNGILAAVTGSPVVVCPVGWSSRTSEAPLGVPIGMEILGLPWKENKLLNIAQRIDDLLSVRRMPLMAEKHVPPKCYETVPRLRSNIGSIPTCYPLGRLKD